MSRYIGRAVSIEHSAQRRARRAQEDRLQAYYAQHRAAACAASQLQVAAQRLEQLTHELAELARLLRRVATEGSHP